MSVSGYSSDFDDDSYHANDELRFDDHLGGRLNATLVGTFAATRIGVRLLNSPDMPILSNVCSFRVGIDFHRPIFRSPRGTR
jgi:hypothetical protein